MKKYSLAKFTNKDWVRCFNMSRADCIMFLKTHPFPYIYAETEEDFVRLFKMKMIGIYDQEFINDVIERRIKAEHEYGLKLLEYKEEKLKQKITALFNEAFKTV